MSANVLKAIEPQQPIGIFISYSSESEGLARKLKDQLKELQGPVKLDVFVAAEMGRGKWRDLIYEYLARARVLILPYTSATMRLDWCSYELGRFHAASPNNHTICIRNTNLPTPPPQIADLQSYSADRASLRKFFLEFFEESTFNNKVPVNPRVDRDILNKAVLDLEAEFATFRVEEHFYPYRITISSPSESKIPSRLDFNTAEVTGDSRALQIFGATDGVSWTRLKEICLERFDTRWPEELERAAKANSGELATRSLSPFSTKSRGSFIPAISRVESFEGKVPWRLNVIFVELETGGTSHESALGSSMPDNWTKMLSFLTVALRFRWQDLVPVHSVLLRPETLGPEWKAAVDNLFINIKSAQNEMRMRGAENYDKFFALYDRDLQALMQESFAPYRAALEQLKAAGQSGNREDAVEAILKIREVNSKYLGTTLVQFERLVERLDAPGEASPAPPPTRRPRKPAAAKKRAAKPAKRPRPRS